MTQQSEASLCLHANAGRLCGSAWVLFVCVCVPVFLCGRTHTHTQHTRITEIMFIRGGRQPYVMARVREVRTHS